MNAFYIFHVEPLCYPVKLILNHCILHFDLGNGRRAHYTFKLYFCMNARSETQIENGLQYK